MTTIDCIKCLERKDPTIWYGYCGLYHSDFPEKCSDFKPKKNEGV
jgi:hypothetical protein